MTSLQYTRVSTKQGQQALLLRNLLAACMSAWSQSSGRFTADSRLLLVLWQAITSSYTVPAQRFRGLCHTQRGLRTVELALELGEHEGDGLGGPGGGGHNVERGCARTAQVAMGSVQQPLVSGVGVGGRHCSLDDAELLVQHLPQHAHHSKPYLKEDASQVSCAGASAGRKAASWFKLGATYRQLRPKSTSNQCHISPKGHGPIFLLHL